MRSQATLVAKLLTVSVLLTLPAWSQAGQAPSVEIHGRVRGPSDLRAVLVTLESTRMTISPQRTQPDSQGKFDFQGLAQDVYRVTAVCPGYMAVTERLDLQSARSGYAMLEMRPVPSEGPPAVPPEGPAAALSGSPAIPEGARQEFEKGGNLLLKKKPESAVSHFQRALELYPNYQQASLALGTALMDQGKYQEALPHLEKAIEIKEDVAGVHMALGACQGQLKNFPAAEKHLLRGLELDPTFAPGYLELARVYWTLGRWQEAESPAAKAVELKPDLAVAHLLLGNIKLRNRDAAGALAHYKQYLALEPQGALAAPVREQVAKIEKALASK
jgi:Flp pilus assembly protein TadD